MPTFHFQVLHCFVFSECCTVSLNPDDGEIAVFYMERYYSLCHFKVFKGRTKKRTEWTQSAWECKIL